MKDSDKRLVDTLRRGVHSKRSNALQPEKGGREGLRFKREKKRICNHEAFFYPLAAHISTLS